MTEHRTHHITDHVIKELSMAQLLHLIDCDHGVNSHFQKRNENHSIL